MISFIGGILKYAVYHFINYEIYELFDRISDIKLNL